MRYRLRTLLFAFVLFAIVGTAAKFWYDLDRRLKSEYGTAQVIRDVTQYVQTHQGNWPRSWADIPEGEYAHSYVKLRFDVDPKELVANPQLIQTTITPLSGEYRTYPHAERQLNELRDELAKFPSP
jgi:hypothetical protein